jgi:protein-S-isoprenylcysteine O-methyltransferase Ste14
MISLANVPACAAFAAAVTVSHGAFLVRAKRAAGAPEAVRERLWRWHNRINGTLWVLLFLWVVLLQGLLPASTVPPPARVAGLVLFAAGILLVGHTRRLLGCARAMGVRFFFPERAAWVDDDVYRVLNNPMYDGFVLVLVGAGAMLGIKGDFALAGASFVLLNLGLAQVENGPGRRSPW